MSIKEWWWNKLYSWQRHAIVLFSVLVVGDWIVYTFMIVPFGFPTVAVATFNFMLNFLALVYAVFAYYKYDKEAEKQRKEFEQIGIDPPTWQGLAKYLARELVPSISFVKELSEQIDKEDLELVLKEAKVWIENKKTRDAIYNAEKMLDEGGV